MQHVRIRSENRAGCDLCPPRATPSCGLLPREHPNPQPEPRPATAPILPAPRRTAAKDVRARDPYLSTDSRLKRPPGDGTSHDTLATTPRGKTNGARCEPTDERDSSSVFTPGLTSPFRFRSRWSERGVWGLCVREITVPATPCRVPPPHHGHVYVHA